MSGAARRLKVPPETWPLFGVISIAFVGGVVAIAKHFYSDQTIRIAPTPPHGPGYKDKKLTEKVKEA
ncbi:hypothetical protein BT69DRAFT_1282931 [Atractiella rhizophila]|nr:hypothetical protein BT69DRAFT_1284696 [Atractiella rhizophila]KAH8921784.1 hypothetical protein BT69DRAFT_1282931 [Atractiella rhizophila]